MYQLNSVSRKFLLLAAAGTAATAGPALAQPFVINANGATLLQQALTSQAITNDYIDADLNGVARRYLTNQQLAPSNPLTFSPPYFNAGVWWILDYCAIGSVNGVQELATWGRTFDTNNAHNSPSGIRSSTRTVAFFNRTRYINAGIADNVLFNTMNPGGKPVRSAMDGSFLAQYAGDDIPSPGGVTNDVAPVDVPTNWASTRAGQADPHRLPGQSGYGNNQIQVARRDGTLAADECGLAFGHTLAELGTATIFDPKNPGAADANTIFDTPIAFAPIAPFTNFGTGKQTATFSELRHLFVTGRLPNGENLLAVTRDSGSGTRNGFYNSLCIDPSWGIGENVGTLSTLAAWNKLGPEFTPSSKGGSGGAESTFINHRLAIGYTGAERAVSQTLVTGGRAEILGVRDDLHAGIDFVRPTIDTILNNGYRGQDDPSNGADYTRDGWRIGGPAVFASFGSPLSNSANKGGIGWGETFTDANGNGRYDAGEAFDDRNANGERDAAAEPFLDQNANGVYDAGEPFTDIDGNGVYSSEEVRAASLLPAMRNPEAAAFLNNISRSISAFAEAPGGSDTLFTPGEFLAANFILVAATDYVQDLANPCAWVPNPALNQTVQNFNLSSVTQVYSNPAFAAFGVGAGSTSRAGKVPTRQVMGLGAISCGATPPSENGAPITYSDGVSGTSVYNLDTAGAAGTLAYNTNLSLRNLIAGDFNADGRRTLNDAADMLRAWRQRNTGPAWTAPDATADLAALATSLGVSNPRGIEASIEILGDFNGDGNFGRTWNGSAFVADTSDVRYWADGLAIDPATGNLNRALGFTRIDQEWQALTGSSNFFGTTLATGVAYAAGDSRADISSPAGVHTPNFAPIGTDGVVNGYDIDYVYAQFVRNPRVSDGALTWSNLDEAANSGQFRPDLSGDITGDLVINQADIDAIVLGILHTTYGDVNLDGVADAADRSIVQSNLGNAGGWAQGDVNGDGQVTQIDLDIVNANIGGGNDCPCDFNSDTTLNSQDFFDFLTAFFSNSPSADYNADKVVNSQDFFDFLSCFFAPPKACF
jgi:hypothetical protein